MRKSSLGFLSFSTIAESGAESGD